MKKRLVITDLTRMQQGHVCFCGYDRQHACVRPILLHGIPETALVKDGQPVIFPFALVEFDFLSPRPEAPHTEDYFYISSSPVLIQRVANPQRVLDWSVFETVEDIFEQPVLTDFGFSVLDNQGPRSVGTLRPKSIHKISYDQSIERGAWDFRLNFYDSSDDYFRLKITDFNLALLYKQSEGSVPRSKRIGARNDQNAAGQGCLPADWIGTRLERIPRPLLFAAQRHPHLSGLFGGENVCGFLLAAHSVPFPGPFGRFIHLPKVLLTLTLPRSKTGPSPKEHPGKVGDGDSYEPTLKIRKPLSDF